MSVPEYEPADPTAVDPEAVTYDFHLLEAAIARLDADALARLSAFDDARTALELLADVREARKSLQTIEAAIEAEAADRMAKPRMDFADLFATRRGGDKRTKWDDERVAAKVVETVLVDPETGEMADDEAAHLAFLVRDALLKAGSVNYWRAGVLRGMSIDPDDYCERSPGRRTVEVQRGERPQEEVA